MKTLKKPKINKLITQTKIKQTRDEYGFLFRSTNASLQSLNTIFCKKLKSYENIKKPKIK